VGGSHTRIDVYTVHNKLALLGHTICVAVLDTILTTFSVSGAKEKVLYC
jgi:hypothetical protein